MKSHKRHPLRWVVSVVGFLSVLAFILAAAVIGLAVLTADPTNPVGGTFWVTLGILVGSGLAVGLLYVLLRLLVDIAEKPTARQSRQDDSQE